MECKNIFKRIVDFLINGKNPQKDICFIEDVGKLEHFSFGDDGLWNSHKIGKQFKFKGVLKAKPFLSKKHTSWMVVKKYQIAEDIETKPYIIRFKKGKELHPSSNYNINSIYTFYGEYVNVDPWIKITHIIKGE